MINIENKKVLKISNKLTAIGKVFNKNILIWKSLPIEYTEKIIARSSSQGMVMEGESCLYEKLKTLN